MSTSRLGLFCGLFLLLACQQDRPPARGAELPPNFVIIFTDDQGYQDVGCFGSPDITTPNLDRMAAEGARLSQFYVSQGVCSASRASLLTGCYANRVGVHGAYFPKAKSGLAPEEMTLAEMLKPWGIEPVFLGSGIWGITRIYCPRRRALMSTWASPIPMTCGLPILPTTNSTSISCR